MPKMRLTPRVLGSATALALLMAPMTLLAQDQASEASQGTQTELDIQAADQQDSGTTQTTDAAGTSSDADAPVAQSASADRDPIPLVPNSTDWSSFHGQLNAQKYSPLKQITADNVDQLEKVWDTTPAISPMARAIPPLPCGPPRRSLPTTRCTSPRRSVG